MRARRGPAIDAAGRDALDLGKLLALDLYLAGELAGRGHHEGKGSLGCVEDSGVRIWHSLTVDWN